MLLHGVRRKALQREREQLAQVRLPLLHGPGMTMLSVDKGVDKHGSCEHMVLHTAAGVAGAGLARERSECLPRLTW